MTSHAPSHHVRSTWLFGVMLAASACEADPGGGTGGESEGSTSTAAATDGTGDPTGGESEGSEGPSGSTSTDGGSSTGGADESSSGGAMPVDYEDVYPLDTTYPEGGTFDPVEQMFFVGTLEGGEVHRVDPRDGTSTLVFEEPTAGEWMTLGMAVDASRRRLWVCAADRQTDPYTGQVWVFDLDTDDRLEVVELSHAGEAAWCEDVAVAGDGTAYVTDRENPNIYRVSDDFEATLFATDDALGSPLIGQNGIIVLPGDEALIAAVHLPAALNYVSLSDGAVTPIEIDGDFVDAGIGSGADGMVLVDGELYVVFDGELARVAPTLADWSAAFSTAVELPRGLTDVIDTPGGLYLLNGQAIRFALGQEPNGPFELVRFSGDL